MPKKSKRKDKNTEEPKNRASSNSEAGSDASTSEHFDVQYRKVPVKSDTDPNEYREDPENPVSLSTCLDLMKVTYESTPTKACTMVNDDHLGIKLACLGSAKRSSDIEEDGIERPLSVFELPKRNIFCPDDLRMVDAPVVLQKFPVKVHSDSMSEVWYKFDPELRAPKCNMNFTYMSPLPLESPENAAMLELFALVLEDLTHDELYPATVAGLSYTIESYLLGLTIRVSAYTQKLPLLAEVIAQSIPKSYQSLTMRLFEMRRKELLDRYRENFSSDLNLARQIRQSIVMSGRWTEVQKHAALACVQLERFQHFMEHFLDHAYIKYLVEGNIAEADAVKTALRVVEVSQCGPLPRNMIPRVRINTIPRGKHCCTVETFRLDSSDVTVENYYQFDDSSMELGGMLRFLVSCSTDLATRAFCESEVAIAASCMPAIIKSGVNNYSLALVDARTSTINAQRIASVDAGIEEQQQISRDFLKDNIEDVWEQAKYTIDAVMRQTVNNYPSEFMNNWEDIVNGEYGFGKPSRQLDALHEMDSADIQKWIKYITDDSNVRKLSVRIVGDKYSRADFSTPETQPDESNNGQQNIPIYRLHYLTENAGQSENTSYNCITNVQEFKKQLEASSNTNVNSC